MTSHTSEKEATVTYTDEVQPGTAADYDTQRLEELGYKQEFDREISLFVQAGFAFSTMAVLPNWYTPSQISDRSPYFLTPIRSFILL